MTVTFFGHGDTPESVLPKIESVLTRLIDDGAGCFYVGNHGNFDILVRKTLKKLKSQYPHIQYAVVLAYLPLETADAEAYSDTVYPDGLETVPLRFAISKRNRWMLKQADTVVAYVKSATGGATKWKTLAEKQGKTVINLAEW